MEILYHYTSFDALIGILEKEHLCFWGNRYDSMNDPTEVKYAKDIVIPLLEKSFKGTEKEFDAKDVDEIYAYIVSFSKKQDDFNMWRLYNAEVALVVDKEKLRDAKISSDDSKTDENVKQEVIVKDVQYGNDEDIPKLAAQLFNDSPNQFEDFIDTFNIEVFPYIKNVAFEIEGEVRMVCLDFEGYTFSCDDDVSITETEIPHNVKCRGSRNGSILLYKEFLVNKDALQKIVIRTHDEEYFQKVKKQLQVLLVSNGYRANLPIERTQSFKFIETKR